MQSCIQRVSIQQAAGRRVSSPVVDYRRDARSVFGRVLVGGIDERGTLMQGSMGAIEREVRDAIDQTGGRRLMLGPGCVVPIAVSDDAIETVVTTVRETAVA